jgi:hypothetical protein
VAAHVLGRRRYDVTAHFGLRASPGGFATPAFGDAPETLRVARAHLIREVGGDAKAMPLDGSTLRALAAFAGADITRAFNAGADTPAVGDPDEVLRVDVNVAAELADWYAFGWQVLDDAVGASGAAGAAATIQLWPEHFDAGTTLSVGEGRKVNLGVSPGDAFGAEPYLYVGPWDDVRSIDPGYFNAPFGAVVRRSEVLGTADPMAAALDFVRKGLGLVAGAEIAPR